VNQHAAPLIINLGMPKQIAAQGGQQRELDVAHVGGSPQGPTPAIVANVAGTGTAGRLSTFRVQGIGQAPPALVNGAAMLGRNFNRSSSSSRAKHRRAFAGRSTGRACATRCSSRRRAR
jgi:hypothetical protein